LKNKTEIHHKNNALTMFDPIKDLEKINSHTRKGLAEYLGIKIVEIASDSIIASMPVNEKTQQPFGLLHGGASVVLAETLGSVASFLLLDDPLKQRAVGLEINANHLRGVSSGLVFGTVTAVHIGKKTHVWSIIIKDSEQKNICMSRITVMII
jgi:1,4-dihydroxy-2-naphthoyl-CoA hydrolase